MSASRNKLWLPIFLLLSSLSFPFSLNGQQKDVAERDPLMRQALAALNAGRYDAAIERLTQVAKTWPDYVSCHLMLGDAYFMAAKMKQSVASYDRALELSPQLKPRCWQRGLALYYAGSWELGKQQFETHQTWNSQDVENAVWHMLCVSKLVGVDKARQQLIDIRGDGRVPMAEIFRLFAGKGSVDEVREAADDPDASGSRRRMQMYYAKPVHRAVFRDDRAAREGSGGHAEGVRETTRLARVS